MGKSRNLISRVNSIRTWYELDEFGGVVSKPVKVKIIDASLIEYSGVPLFKNKVRVVVLLEVVDDEELPVSRPLRFRVGVKEWNSMIKFMGEEIEINVPDLQPITVTGIAGNSVLGDSCERMYKFNDKNYLITHKTLRSTKMVNQKLPKAKRVDRRRGVDRITKRETPKERKANSVKEKMSKSPTKVKAQLAKVVKDSKKTITPQKHQTHDASDLRRDARSKK